MFESAVVYNLEVSFRGDMAEKGLRTSVSTVSVLVEFTNWHSDDEEKFDEEV